MDSEFKPPLSGASRDVASIADRPVMHIWLTAGVLVLLSASCIALFDHACSGFIGTHSIPDEISDLLQAAEHFGTPYGAVLILVTVWLAHPSLRSRVSRTFFAAVAAGLLADLIKLCVSRTRPKAFDFDQSIWSSFTGAFQWGAGGSKHQGFPSAHTAFAIAFAVMLGELFPRARRWFWCLGALVACQRVVELAHFPSDVLTGAAVGLLTARYFLGSTPMGLAYDRMERYYFPEQCPVQVGALAAQAASHTNSIPTGLSPVGMVHAEAVRSL
jgi:membrane-associated phospholipid phosphatase